MARRQRPSSTAPQRRQVRRVPRRGKSVKRGTSFYKTFSRVVAGLAAVLFVAVSAGAIGFMWIADDLPSIEVLENTRKEPRATIVDRYGAPLAVRGQDHGAPVSVDALPPHVVHAFLATEDRNFFHHIGVNPVAILRAFTVNVRDGGISQGGSTITQQLVKNLYLTPERTLRRKIEEMVLALQIEARFTKEEILNHYLNAVYFGNGAYGLEAAARRYFAKFPDELTVGEAAMLAGLLKAPSKLAPTNDKEAALGRARTVLNAMVDAGFLGREDANAVISAGIAQVIPIDQRFGHAADAALIEAVTLVGALTEDIVVTTSLDAALTNSVMAIRDKLASVDPLMTEEVETALLALEQDGAIRVMIGGNDYHRSAYNRATQARRQPGSVFKPFVYLAAVEAGWLPEDLVDDTPIVFGDYAPDNYRDRYYGTVTLTEALSRSLNAAALRLQENVGRDQVVRAARRSGLDGMVDIGPSLGLGVIEQTPLDMARAYLPFIRDGNPGEPFLVTKITTGRGDILFERTEEPLADFGMMPFSEDTLVAMDHMLRYVVHSGSGRAATVRGHHAAGKTGTSQNSRDAWFAGYVSGMVGVVWIGRDDDGSMRQGASTISGAGAPARLWGEMMTLAVGDRAPVRPKAYLPRRLPTLANAARPEFDLTAHLAAILGVAPPPVAGQRDPEEVSSESAASAASSADEAFSFPAEGSDTP